jgi:hypothetical protein
VYDEEKALTVMKVILADYIIALQDLGKELSKRLAEVE